MGKEIEPAYKRYETAWHDLTFGWLKSQKGKQRERAGERKYLSSDAKNFTKVMKINNPQTQEAQRASSRKSTINI